jgi:hypothetical protein
MFKFVKLSTEDGCGACEGQMAQRNDDAGTKCARLAEEMEFEQPIRMISVSTSHDPNDFVQFRIVVKRRSDLPSQA